MGMYDGGLLNLALVRKFLISSLRVVYHYPSRWSKGRDEPHLLLSANLKGPPSYIPIGF